VNQTRASENLTGVGKSAWRCIGRGNFDMDNRRERAVGKTVFAHVALQTLCRALNSAKAHLPGATLIRIGPPVSEEDLMFALQGNPPQRPGLLRGTDASTRIEVEVWPLDCG
jgi:hypothetical protein